LMENWTSRDQNRLMGLSREDTYKLLVSDYNLDWEWERFNKAVDEIAEVIYDKCELIDGFLDFIKSLQGKITVGLASSAKRKDIDIICNKFNLYPFFETIVSSNDVGGKSKPDPLIYLHSAKTLNANPEECIAIEDSRNGVLSAKAAGMTCIGFRNGINDGQDLSAADVIVKSFDEIDLTLFN